MVEVRPPRPDQNARETAQRHLAARHPNGDQGPGGWIFSVRPSEETPGRRPQPPGLALDDDRGTAGEQFLPLRRAGHRGPEGLRRQLGT